MTVERARLIEYWPLVDVGKLQLVPGDVVIFRSTWLADHGEHRMQFFEVWKRVFPGVHCVAITAHDDPGIVIKRAMPEMRAEDLVQPERQGTMG